MAYLHEISNWHFFLKPGKCQQPVTPTRHFILSERPRSQSREANKNNNKEKKKTTNHQKVLKSDFTFPFASLVFFRQAKQRWVGQRSVVGGFWAPLECEDWWDLECWGGAGCSLPESPHQPFSSLHKDTYLQNPISSPKHPRGCSILPRSSRPRRSSGTLGRPPPAETGFG